MEQENTTTSNSEDVTVVGTSTDTNSNDSETVESNLGDNGADELTTPIVNNTETKTEAKEETEKEIMIPKKRFDEVNNKYKELVQQMESLKEKDKETESKIEEETKQEETVTNPKLEELEKQVESFQNVFTEMVDAKIKEIPEDMRDLIPEGLTIEQKLSWINKAEEKGLFKKKQNVVVGQPLNHSSEQEKKERIKKLNPLQLLSSYYGESK